MKAPKRIEKIFNSYQFEVLMSTDREWYYIVDPQECVWDFGVGVIDAMDEDELTGLIINMLFDPDF